MSFLFLGKSFVLCSSMYGSIVANFVVAHPLTPFAPRSCKIYYHHDPYLKITTFSGNDSHGGGGPVLRSFPVKKLLTAARFNCARAFKTPMLIFTLGPYLKHKYLCLKTINLNCSCKVRFGVDVCYKRRQNNRHLGVLEPQSARLVSF